MHRIIAKQVQFNVTTGQIDLVWIGYFDKNGVEVRTELLSGRLFPSDLKNMDEITFIQKSKVEQVENLAKLGEAITQ